jgi:hypothetical protein
VDSGNSPLSRKSRPNPQLIVGGAAKSGTTALYYYLRQHPGYCLPEKKELHFFSRPWLEGKLAGPGDRFVLAEVPKTLDEYLSFFSHCNVNQVAVDNSPSYLFHHQAAEAMKGNLGEVGIVFILRNPAEKAFSQYLHLVGAGRETLSFEEALSRESEREADGFADMWLYRASGCYAIALEHYEQVFGRDHLQIFYHDEFLGDPVRVLREICAFAGVDQAFRFRPVSDINRSGRPKSLLMAKILGPSPFTFLLRRVVPKAFGRSARKLLRDWNTGAKPVLAEDLRQSLIEHYSDDIRRVEALVGRQSGWLS